MGAINHSLLSFGFKVQLGQHGFKRLYAQQGRNLAAYPRSLSQGIAFPALTEVRRVRVCDDPTASETQSVPVGEQAACDRVTAFLVVSSLAIAPVVASVQCRWQQVSRERNVHKKDISLVNFNVSPVCPLLCDLCLLCFEHASGLGQSDRGLLTFTSVKEAICKSQIFSSP